jgi:PAS domain S-box-containing protein
MSRQRIIATGVAAIAVVATFLWIPHARATSREMGVGTYRYPPSVSVGAQEQPDAVPLTADEKAWLRDHPSLRLGVDPAWPPYEFVDQMGRYSGIAADYVKLIRGRLGIAMEVQPDLTWEQVLTKLDNKELDVSPALTQTPERSRFLLFTHPYTKYSVAIVTRSDHSGAKGLTALAGRKVALVKSYAFTEIALKTQPDIIPVHVDTILEGLNKVSNSEAEAIVSDLPSLSYKISEYNFLNLKVAGIAPFETEGLSMGVRNDWPVLVSILEKVLASITPEEHQQIRQRWITHQASETVAIDLSPEEQEWLARHPVIKNMMDPDWAPVEFIDEQGRPSGITSEYLSRLEQILHVKFENPKGMTWAQMMDALKDGRLDMASCFRDTPQRRQFMDFTDAYLSMPTAIFTRNDVSYVDLASLKGKPVAVVEGYAVQGFLNEGHPEIPLVTVRNLKEGLTLLSEGKVYAYIDALAPGSYGLTRYGFTNIRAAGETPFRYEMSMAASKQQPELASILEKAIKAVPEADRNRFYQKWSNVQVSYKPDYAVIWKILAGSAGLVLIFAYWTRRLSAEVSRRRQVETELRQAKEELELRVEERTAELEARNVALAEEVLERKRAISALRTSEKQYRSVIENIQDVFYRSDSKGRLLMGSPSGAKMFGYDSVDEMLGLPLDSFWPDPMERQQLLAQIKATGSARDFEAVLRRRDGTTFSAVFTTHFYYDDDGNLLGTEGIIRDVTERKRAEEEMSRLRNYLENIFNSMPSVLVGVDRDGKVTQWNAAAESVTGIRTKEAQGQSLEQVLPMLSHGMNKIREAIRERVVKAEAKVPWMADGQMHYQDVTVYPLVSNGVEGAVIRVDDVTERVQIEEMMIQSEKMLSVGGLAAGMAHEINNPLGTILQASQNVLRRISPDLPANARIAEECGTNLNTVRKYLEKRGIAEFLQDIRNSGQRAAQIVENMLSFSRKSDAEGILTSLAELLDRTLLLAESDYDLKKRYDFRQIETVREYHPDAPPVVCQPSKIQQVFLNILRNGAEAMGEVRDLDRLPRFVLKVLPDGPMVRVEIEDNGPGMDETTRKRLFEPFFTTKPPGIGTGLGMSVSYFIVTEEHHGALMVESQPGTGSRFIIRLPVADRE